MLNEIFKGMDNAAEVIHQNFQQLDYEEGSNENGSWRKYSDGRLEVEHNLTISTSNLTFLQTGQIFYSNMTWIFPQGFVDDKTLITASVSSASAAWVSAGVTSSSETEYRILFPRNESGENRTLNIRIRATGRWKN